MEQSAAARSGRQAADDASRAKDPSRASTSAETDCYQEEYVASLVDKWDALIDWSARAESEGDFFIQILRALGKETVLDVAAGTGFHSVRLQEAGFNVTSADGSAEMLIKAFENGRKRGLILKTVQADWRWLNRDIQGKYDAIVCLGNSFTHLHDEQDRRRALAEFYAALKHDGVLILDQRNYDAMLDRGYSSKHKYYYCGDVTATPVHVSDDLVTFQYQFPDGSEFELNINPIRKDYTRRLIREAGFERVRTYGDFQEIYKDDEPDFFVHVAEKSVMNGEGWRPAEGDDGDYRIAAKAYYDNPDSHAFYSMIWGGEDLHIGLYPEKGPTPTVREASDAIVDRMAATLTGLGAGVKVLDLGAGFGGSARRLAGRYGCSVRCLNLSEYQNAYNLQKIKEAGLEDKVSVAHGVFEDVPEADESFDVVWSQDAILHSDRRAEVLGEAFRVLKPGGQLIFTDPMRSEAATPESLQPILDRVGLADLGSWAFYEETAKKLGFEALDQIELTSSFRTHYARIAEELEAHYDQLREKASAAYLDKMLAGLRHWVDGADRGDLTWGIQRFRKPL